MNKTKKDKCKNCGHPLSSNNNPQFLILETDIKRLKELFDGGFDHVKCDACQRPLGIIPTLVLMFSEPPVIKILFGSEMDEEEKKEFFANIPEEINVIPEEIFTLDDLRNEVAKITKKRITIINDFLIARAKDTLVEYMSQNWRSLTPSLFSAISLMLVTPIPGVQIGVGIPVEEGTDQPPSISVNEILPIFAEIQTLSWFALFDSCKSEEYTSTLEEDLKKYLDRSVIFPGSLKLFCQICDQLKTNFNNGLEHFCLEAIRASLYAVTGEDNPHVNEWAELFFSYEFLCYGQEQSLDPHILSLRISDERAQQTIKKESAWDAIARRFQRIMGQKNPQQEDVEQFLNNEIPVLRQIAKKAGFPGLVEDVFFDGRRVESSTEIPIEDYIQYLQQFNEGVGQFDNSLTVLARPIAQSLVAQNRAEDLEKLTDEMMKMIGDSRENQARVEAWVGKYFKELRQPQRFLNRIGENVREWETDLTIKTQIDLCTERSNALRILGKREQALEIAQDVATLVLKCDGISEHDRRTAQLNVAILSRETGELDAALEIFHQLNAQTTREDRDKLSILDSIAVTYAALGQDNQAVEYLDQALQLATGLQANQFYRLKAFKANLLAVNGCSEKALEILEELSTEEDQTNVGMSHMIAAWTNILSREPDLVSEEKIMQVEKSLLSVWHKAKDQGDLFGYFQTSVVRAVFFDITNHFQLREFCEFAYQEYLNYQQLPDPSILIILSRLAYQDNNLEEARQYLLQVPRAIAAQMGGIRDLGLTFDATRMVRGLFYRLIYAVLTDESVKVHWQDVRLVCELCRDVIGRGKLIRQQQGVQDVEFSLLENGLSNEVLKQLAPKTGNLGVVEWVSAGQYGGCFLTRITSTGEVSSRWLSQPDIDPVKVAEELRYRLNTWRKRSPGDPLDLPEWKQLEQWLIDQLSPYLVEGDHLVFIEHEAYLGLPWHIAVSHHWSSSYALSWTTLLSIHNQSPLEQVTTLGVLQVPRFKEDRETIDAFEQSSQRTQTLADTHQFNLIAPQPIDCDHIAFKQMMEQADIVKLLCHGFPDQENEVAFAIAHGQSLPLKNNFALKTPKGRAYHLSWRDCQNLSKSPAVVFSVACSSGISKIAGLGEGLGVFNALKYNNTKTFIAPRWDIYGEMVLPILDDLLDQYTTTQQGLAQALRQACIMAEREKSIPRWLAWSLTIEGDWR
ncbi:tetratricopeptide repeat protein [Crocosphaera sp.]|uniref:tetratricopeptide repeat protein n=1 Tax=Crocosphaera sp. TaxID=2729996 RepID=UPI003F1FD33E|nr:hypothetical protein [Crocosphaera sp.]